MNLLSMFYAEAKRRFAQSKTSGEFAGINIEDGAVYIIYTTPEGATGKTWWSTGAITWEEILRTMTNSYN
jgi:hypothetical protein